MRQGVDQPGLPVSELPYLRINIVLEDLAGRLCVLEVQFTNIFFGKISEELGTA
jgi:hypothetical protein